MLVTFGATFFGVIASFLFWFGGQWWIKRQRDKKAIKHMMQEIHEEIQLNIDLLIQLAQSIPRELNKGKTSLYLPNRMRLTVYNYIVSSGEIRLLPSRRKQQLIRYSALICESFNKFIDNTEMLVAIFVLKPSGLVVAKYRLERLAEQAMESAQRLDEYLKKLQQVDLPEEDNMDEPKKIDLEDIEAHLTRIEGSLKRATLSGKYISTISLSIAAIAIGGSGLDIDLWGRILLVGGGIAVIFGSSLAVIFRRNKN